MRPLVFWERIFGILVVGDSLDSKPYGYSTILGNPG